MEKGYAPVRLGVGRIGHISNIVGMFAVCLKKQCCRNGSAEFTPLRSFSFCENIINSFNKIENQDYPVSTYVVVIVTNKVMTYNICCAYCNYYLLSRNIDRCTSVTTL